MKNSPWSVDDFRERSERFLRELSEEHYRTGAGLTDRSNLTAIYERYRDLVSSEILGHTRELVRLASGEDARRLPLLLSFVVNLIVGDAAKQIVDEKNTFEANATVRLPWPIKPPERETQPLETSRSQPEASPPEAEKEGPAEARSLSYRLSAVLLQNEPDLEKRRIIDESRREIHREMTPIISRLLETAYAAFARLGYPEYIDAVEQLERINLYRLKEKMSAFLSETESPYRAALSVAVEKKLGLPLENVHKRDIGYLFRGADFDAVFVAEKLIPAAKETLSAMGLDLYAAGRIHLDTERRPKKSPRAFCVPLSVPENVILVTMSSGGLSDYGSFLHELGHALHFANVAPVAPFEYRWLGDNSVTESFAMLFEHLLLNPAWLKEYLPASRKQQTNGRTANLRDYLQHARLYLCYMVRRYAAKLIYELALHDPADTQDKASLYRKILSEACLVEYPEDDYLVDLDMHFYCARYLRAWIFEANLSSFLEKEFGEKWFQNPNAGRFLLDLWKDGQKFTVEEIGENLRFDSLDTRPLIQRLKPLV